MNRSTQHTFQFEGFHKNSKYTYTPDFMMDYFPAVLTSAEIKVSDYLFRRASLGDHDVSLNQMQNGLVTSDDTRLDYGCGLSKPTIIKALKGLVKKSILHKLPQQGGKQEHLANRYQLNYGVHGWNTDLETPKLISKNSPIIDREDFVFEGFDFPTFTPIPDIVYDVLLKLLSTGGYLALRYICRHTFGYKKREDDISINQMLNGIISKTGVRIDNGCGIKGRKTLINSLRELEKFGIVSTKKNKSKSGANATTTYKLIFKSLLVKKASPPSKEIEPPLVKNQNPQKTAIQKQQQVVVVLTEFGYSHVMAKKLSSNRTLEYIQEKIDILQFIENESPNKIQNRLGWLRNAIEQDYKEPSNFKPLAEQKKETFNWEEWHQETTQIQAEKRQCEHESLQQATDRRKHVIEKASIKFDTTLSDTESWDGIKEMIFFNQDEIFNQVVALKFDLDQKNVVLGVLNQTVFEKLSHHVFKQKLKNDIGRMLKIDIQTVVLVLLTVENQTS